MRSIKAPALAAMCAAFAVATPAHGQCRLCSSPSTARSDQSASGDVQLQIETELNFDRLILNGGGPGGATIRPDGSSAAEGSVAQVGPRASVGTVLVHGEPGRAVTIDLPHRIDLYSISGARITLQDVTVDALSSPRLDAAGNLSFRFGGRLVMLGDADGQYRGDLPITVNYADDLSGSVGSLTSR